MKMITLTLTREQGMGPIPMARLHQAPNELWRPGPANPVQSVVMSKIQF